MTENPLSQPEGLEYLVQVSQELSLARNIDEVMKVTREAARRLCGADGATFVLREEGLCYYADEDAIAPLWKGRRFPIHTCISGWAMLNREAVIIDDITADSRIPQDAYASTFVKSLVMVPIREINPIGAIGNYWAHKHVPPPSCVKLLRSLANLVSIAIENVQTVEKLEKTNRFLEDSVRSRDEFLSVVSHELRTPLSTLKLQIQMLAREDKPEAARLQKATDLSLRQVQNLGRLVENLLDVSHIRSERIKLNLEPVELSKLVMESTELFAPQMESSKNKIQLDLTEGIFGRWDESRLMQVISNLIANACKYAPDCVIRISTRKTTGIACLIVEDSGPGIAEKDRERVFERFERGDSEQVGGLGLGLFISRKLVEAHGGRLLLSESAQGGAKFTIELPCV